MSKQPKQRNPVLVTTAHRGVFFGYLVGKPSKAKAVLTRARNITHWDASVRSFIGLAANGPTEKCRVSPAVRATTLLYDITGVFECSADVAAKFEAEPWA